MFLVVNANGSFWDGIGWSTKGKVFCTVGRATRSLHEEGEGVEGAAILPLETVREHFAVTGRGEK